MSGTSMPGMFSPAAGESLLSSASCAASVGAESAWMTLWRTTMPGERYTGGGTLPVETELTALGAVFVAVRVLLEDVP